MTIARTLAVLSLTSLVACASSSNAPSSSGTSQGGSSGDAPEPTPPSATPEAGTSPSTAETPAARLLRHLEGTFDTAAQAKADREYFDITLTHCRVDLPSLGKDVLYVEQARTSSLAAPYRQRVYVIDTKGEDTAVSRIFEHRDPKVLTGLCAKTPRPALSAADLEEKAGCAVTMAWKGDRFEGSTAPRACLSNYQGATYTMSEVSVSPTEVRSWDRGFDASDQQVWGAAKGPYVFVRKTPLAP